MNTPDYAAFAEKCMAALKPIQHKFRTEFAIDGYANWFYSHDTGLLTLSTGDEEINFRYFDMGSFSKKVSTWNWAWDNASTPDNIRQQSFFLKEFGEKNGFSKLTTGYFASDEFDAWEFAAIAVHLTHAIGVYRPFVTDTQLQLFLIVTEVVDNDTARQIKEKYISCSRHDYARMAFVCQHLLPMKDKVGFEEAFETQEGMELLEDDDLQAWCDECERIRQNSDGWNDESQAFAQIQLVCEKCYFEMKEFNLGHR